VFLTATKAAPSAPSTRSLRPGLWQGLFLCGLLVIVGANLRTVILAVPPVLPLIRSSLGLSYTSAGVLTALPTLLMGGAAWVSGLLAERIGGRMAVTIGLALLAFGALMRAVWPIPFGLFAFTIVLSLGIALAQTSVPPLIKQWFPTQIGLVSALFTDGLIIGETLSAGLTVPLMIGLFGADAWIQTFLLWGAVAVGVVVLWFVFAPSKPRVAPVPTLSATPNLAQSNAASVPVQEARLAPTAFIIPGLLLGCGSLMYFAMNTWIASYNQASHATGYTPLALTTLNALQLPASLGVTFFAQRLAGKRWPFVVSGVMTLVATIGLVTLQAGTEVYWAGMIGAASAFVFALGLALPPLLAPPAQVARLTGLTLTLSYSMAFLGPFLGGALWDHFGAPPLVFLPIMLASAVLCVLGFFVPQRFSDAESER